MIPILFEKSAKDFTTNGLGRLADAIECKVTEERNDEFELSMQYPVSGAHFSDLINDNIIYAKAYEGTTSDCIQPFRIYKVSKPLGGKVTISARHISYQLSYTPVGFVSSKTRSATSALQAITDAIKNEDNDFTLETDLTGEHVFEVEDPVSVRSALGGDDGFIDIYGGEVKWDHFKVQLLDSRGRDNGVTVRYGKNLKDLKQEENIEKTYSAIFAYYHQSESSNQEEIQVEGSVLKCENAANFPYIRTYIYNAKSDFDDTVSNAYRVGQDFYSDSDHTEGVVAIKDNYYKDQDTILDGYYDGSKFYEDSDYKYELIPETYKYYSDSDCHKSGYYSNGEFWEQSPENDPENNTKLDKRLHIWYTDQSNDDDVVYIYDGEKYVRQAGLASDYTNYKALYTWNEETSTYDFYLETDDTSSAIKNYVWRYNGSLYELEENQIPLVSDLDRLAQKYMDEHDFGIPDVDLTISYQPLWQTEEYKDVAPVESVQLCDTVTVIFEKLGVNTTAKVTKTVYNTLLNRYDSIELDSDWNSDDTRTLSGTIANQANSISSASTTISESLQEALTEATERITGGRGGYVKLMYTTDDNSGIPDELLIMDESDYTKAKNVMRFNKNGIGFSQNGYQGPFSSAWTIDGKFSANWITTGLLTAITMQTASTGLRIVIEGLTSAIKGMSGDEVVNIIDMINGSGADAKMVIDAKKGLYIRTPEMGVVDRSYGTEGGEVKTCLTDSYTTITDVGKYMAVGQDKYHDVKEVYVLSQDEEGAVLCTLPVYLKLTKTGTSVVNGFITSTQTTSTAII